MADLLIKGMEMPTMPETFKQAERVPYIDVRIFADGTAVTSKGERPYYTQYSVVPVPPHGRLIDADVLYKKTAEWEAKALYLVGKYDENTEEWRRWATVLNERTAFKYDVADAPTVIEASEDCEQDGKL